MKDVPFYSLTMTTVTVPTNHKEIADSLYAIKEQLPDGHYLQLMNMLGGKSDVPDITNAKLVKVNVDHFTTEPEDDEECCYGSQIIVKKHIKLLQVVGEDDNSYECADLPDYEQIFEPYVSIITKQVLNLLHQNNLDRDKDECCNHFGYQQWRGAVYRVNSIEVLETYKTNE